MGVVGPGWGGFGFWVKTVEGVSRKQVKETKWEGSVCWVVFCLLRRKSQTKQMIGDNVDDDDRNEGSVGNKVGGKCLVQVAVEGGACTLPCAAEGGVRGWVGPTIPLANIVRIFIKQLFPCRF